MPRLQPPRPLPGTHGKHSMNLSAGAPPVPTDIEIARRATLRPIIDLARERLEIPETALEPYGRHKAKL